MNNLAQKFTKLPEAELPARVHYRTMRHILFESARRPMYISTVLMIIAFFASFWHIVFLAIRNEIPELALLLLHDFEFSVSYLSDVAQMIIRQLPINALIIFSAVTLAAMNMTGFTFQRLNTLRKLTISVL